MYKSAVGSSLPFLVAALLLLVVAGVGPVVD